LDLVEVDTPTPGPTEVRVRVSVCGVCRTDLHVAEGDLPPHKSPVVPGHEVVGTVDALGNACTRFAVGERVGIAWLRRTCGRCRFCRRGDENLCVDPRFTGWDEDGGYAEYAVVDEAYAYAIPEEFGNLHAAPLLCAGIIGYRALKRTRIRPGGRLGIYGFGGSAHLACQVAVAQGLEVHVMTRAEPARSLALELGAASARGAYEDPPVPLDASIVFAPVGDLVPVAMHGLDAGGRLSIAGIYMSPVPSLDYREHVFGEREIASVTANTRADGEEFLQIAARIEIETTVTPYPFAEADRALADLAADRVNGAAVLEVG
jgi:propanol-preferring alcohol dehydrogenase